MVEELVKLVRIVVESMMYGMRFPHGRGRRLALRAVTLLRLVIETKTKPQFKFSLFS